MPGRWGLYIAIAWTLLSLLVATALGPLGLRRSRRRTGAGLGLQRAAVAAEAQRLVGQRRRAGCATKGLPWFTGAAVMAGGAMPGRAHRCCWPLLYSIGAHGIMTLNDFKSIEGDRHMGIAFAAGAARRRRRRARWPAS